MSNMAPRGRGAVAMCERPTPEQLNVLSHRIGEVATAMAESPHVAGLHVLSAMKVELDEQGFSNGTLRPNGLVLAAADDMATLNVGQVRSEWAISHLLQRDGFSVRHPRLMRYLSTGSGLTPLELSNACRALEAKFGILNLGQTSKIITHANVDAAALLRNAHQPFVTSRVIDLLSGNLEKLFLPQEVVDPAKESEAEDPRAGLLAPKPEEIAPNGKKGDLPLCFRFCLSDGMMRSRQISLKDFSALPFLEKFMLAAAQLDNQSTVVDMPPEQYKEYLVRMVNKGLRPESHRSWEEVQEIAAEGIEAGYLDLHGDRYRVLDDAQPIVLPKKKKK